MNICLRDDDAVDFAGNMVLAVIRMSIILGCVRRDKSLRCKRPR